MKQVRWPWVDSTGFTNAIGCRNESNEGSFNELYCHSGRGECLKREFLANVISRWFYALSH